ncbi:DUF2797 domain-containing protein [Psychroflexus sp. YR1-1]|uniref:DUF2797 domain-containing protein n=1 Tax=Psychroflexus aurantiacus TaxID=2709310 RepID=A0A6B3R1G2_9FLAO|nr:DUF2797 domain-containing protein [Psychroflexus aurantiacus]NEV93280.1 DUF2797 domain-containing protein [Psychroflexus aurantiacus]
MQYRGVLRKMKTDNNEEVDYFLEFNDDVVHVNQLLDREIAIYFVGYQCLNCGRNKKIFRQGFCYDCFQEIPNAGDWIMHPELSKAHLDEEDRDLAYEKKVQLQPHVVYLANSSNVKVGVTRKSQIPTRWIDQGAHEAIAILETPNRYLAGITEVALKKHISDKTNWRTMLKNEIEDKNLVEEREKLKDFIPDEAKAYYLDSSKELNINFPVIQYPKKLKSLNLEKSNNFKGRLKGIKGQYLIFENDVVFNVRNSEGYVVDFEVLT